MNQTSRKTSLQAPGSGTILVRKDTCQLMMVVGQCTQTSLVHGHHNIVSIYYIFYIDYIYAIAGIQNKYENVVIILMTKIIAEAKMGRGMIRVPVAVQKRLKLSDGDKILFLDEKGNLVVKKGKMVPVD